MEAWRLTTEPSGGSVDQWSQNCNTLMKSRNRSRIRIKVKIWIRIHNKVMQIYIYTDREEFMIYGFRDNRSSIGTDQTPEWEFTR
jgi:hypothetical protein